MGFRESLFVPSGAVAAPCRACAGWTACDWVCRAVRAAFCRIVRRGFDGFSASTVTAGSTDCCDEPPAVCASATTLDAVATTQASPTLNLKVDDDNELENIGDIPQQSASLRALIVSPSSVPSSAVEFREIQIPLGACSSIARSMHAIRSLIVATERHSVFQAILISKSRTRGLRRAFCF
ncbi:hypothetical protein ACVOMS_06190 [Bradyrhizobium guangxiense]